MDFIEVLLFFSKFIIDYTQSPIYLVYCGLGNTDFKLELDPLTMTHRLTRYRLQWVGRSNSDPLWLQCNLHWMRVLLAFHMVRHNWIEICKCSRMFSWTTWTQNLYPICGPHANIPMTLDRFCNNHLLFLS